MKHTISRSVFIIMGSSLIPISVHAISVVPAMQSPAIQGTAYSSANLSANCTKGALSIMLTAVIPMPASLSHFTSITAHKKNVITLAKAIEQMIEKMTVRNCAPAKVMTKPMKVKPRPTRSASLLFSGFWRRSINFSNQSRPC